MSTIRGYVSNSHGIRGIFWPGTEWTHLDIAQIRGKDRPISQEVTRFVANQGATGIVYGSNLDDLPCAALFEGRSWLTPPDGSEPEELTSTHPDLVAICNEFGLVLEG
jgi:hypothetical protein